MVSTEDGDKSIETTDFDTTILVPWLPRSNPLRNRGGGVTGVCLFGEAMRDPPPYQNNYTPSFALVPNIL